MDPAPLTPGATTLLLAIALGSTRAAAQAPVLERPADSVRAPVLERRLVGWPDPVPNGFAHLPLEALIDLLPPFARARRIDAGKLQLHPVTFEFARRVLDDADLTPAQWFRALRATVSLRYRNRWPAAVPFQLELWRPPSVPNRIRLVPKIEGWVALQVPLFDVEGACGNGIEPGGLKCPDQGPNRLTLGHHALVFELEIGRARGDVAFEVEIVPELDAAMPPVSGAAIDAAVRASFGVAFEPADPTLGDAVLLCEAALDVDPALAHIAVSAEIERLCDGQVVGLTRHVFLPEIDVRMREARGGASSTAEVLSQELERIPAACLRDEHERARWRLRVTSSTRGVLTHWWCDRYWSGSFELPLAEAMEREARRGGRSARVPAAQR